MKLSARLPSRQGSNTTTAVAAAVSILLATLALSLVVSATPLDGTWVEYAPPDPIAFYEGRSAFPMVLDTARDRVIVFSGDRGPKNDVWAYSLGPGGRWTRLYPAGTPPLPRYGAAAIYDAANDRMVVFGGYTYGPFGDRQLKDVWALSLSGTPAWTQITPAGFGPSARQNVGAVYDPSGQRMVVFGGYTGSFTNELWSLSLDGPPAWTQLTPAGPPPSPRNVFGFAYDAGRDRMVIFGGWDGANLSDSWALDLTAGGAWSPIPTAALPSARRGCYAAYDDAGDRLVMFGGFDIGTRDDVWALSFTGTPEWTSLTVGGIAPSRRYGGGAIYDPLRRRFVVCGGYDVTYRMDVHAIALDGPLAWTRLFADNDAGPPPESGAAPRAPSHPGSRRDYAIALDPATSDLYLFGGTKGHGWDYVSRFPPWDCDEFHRLSLASLPIRWQAIVVSGARPFERRGHRAVWDPIRHRMLMFGGFDNIYRNDLWALNPYPTPSWQQLLPTGPPPDGRMLFGMVFDPTHDRLIIVGGHSGFPPTGNLPYRGDAWELPFSGPNAMTWSQLAPAGTPPDPRWIYDMTYDPPRHRALLFGGVTVGGLLNDVWALELGGPAAWSPVTPAGVTPSGRSDHSMIYDPGNDRMVVFGGFDGSIRNDVWSLALSPSPVWSELHPSGVPPAGRDVIHAVYDPLGARLVTYGGWDGANTRSDTWALEWEPGVVPNTASLVESHAEPGLVRLAWFVPDAASAIASVERRKGSGAWATLGTPERSANDRLSLEDRDVTPGARNSYRLRLRVSGEETITDAVEIDVPSGYTLELAGAQPNPAIGERLTVAFALSRKGTARLDLMDLSGRRVASRDVSALGPGRHRVELGESVRLAPGVYVVRLEAEQRSLAKKALVIR